MKQTTPPIYAVYCVADRWHTVARSERPHDRGLERAELRAGTGKPTTPRPARTRPAARAWRLARVS